MTETALAVRQTAIRTYDDVERAAGAMAKSGYFQDSREAAQAVVKILAGQEMGFGPFASMTGIHIIQGRPSIGANLMAAAVKASGRYDYRVIEMTDKACSIRFLQRGEELGVSTFTIDDARKAQTKNLDKFPRNMLFARAMSNGCRWYCPDVFAGAAVYTPEELGAEVNEDGDVITITAQPAPANGNGKPELVQAAKSLGAQVVETGQEEPPAYPEIIDHMVTWTNLARPHVINTLNKCRLPDTALFSEYETWWNLYRGERSTGKNSDEAAAAANEAMKPAE